MATGMRASGLRNSAGSLAILAAIRTRLIAREQLGRCGAACTMICAIRRCSMQTKT